MTGDEGHMSPRGRRLGCHTGSAPFLVGHGSVTGATALGTGDYILHNIAMVGKISSV